MSEKNKRLLERLGGGPSITSRLRALVVVLMVLLIIPSVVSLSVMAYYSSRYHNVVGQVARVSALKPYVQALIPDEMWSVVAGRITFAAGSQYASANYVKGELDQLMVSAGESNRKELIVARRTMDTLVNYINQMDAQLKARRPVAENEALLEEIRGVSTLVSDMLEEYVDAEIDAAAQTSNQLQRMVELITLVLVLLLVLTIAFSDMAQRSLSAMIQRPIAQLEKFAGVLAGGDIGARAPESQVNELRALTNSLNVMASRLGELIEENKREQENLKKSELRALQAQINPHFLYNTLDAIVWLAEADQNGEVIHITRALSDFFRISLSQGKDWIPLSEEVKHLTGYLTIQKIRYRDILDYDIDIPESLYARQILKLLLQPLVENAIYHGIKHRRGRGHVIVTGREMDGYLTLSVRDDGVGMTPERLAEVREALEGHGEETPGYGLFNVNQRIKLYYNQAEGVQIETDGRGTLISLRVPLRDTVHV
ncbi:MAG: histidine kinase [Clostridia bacterium]